MRMDETPSLLPSRALPRRSGILCDDDDGDDDENKDRLTGQTKSLLQFHLMQQQFGKKAICIFCFCHLLV